jgi:hypothetical protein
MGGAGEGVGVRRAHVFLYVISGHKAANTDAALALIERLG